MVSESIQPVEGALPAQEFSINRVLLNNVTFDAPTVPRTLIDNDRGDIDRIDCTIANDEGRLDEHRYVLRLRLEVVATSGSKRAFRAAVEELGIFRFVGYTDEEARAMLQTRGVDLVYPYAREVILSMVSNCGEQRLILPLQTSEIPRAVSNPAANGAATGPPAG